MMKRAYIAPGRLCRALRYWRKKRGLHQWQLANLLGCTQSEICFYEIGERKPRPSTALKMCGILDITTDQLYELSEEQSEYAINYTKFSELLTAYKRDNNLSLNDLRDLTSCSPSSISRYLHNIGRVPWEVVVRIVTVLNLPYDQILIPVSDTPTEIEQRVVMRHSATYTYPKLLNIYTLLQDKRMSFPVLAEKTGYSLSHITQVALGIRKPTPFVIECIAIALNTTSEYILQTEHQHHDVSSCV